MKLRKIKIVPRFTKDSYLFRKSFILDFFALGKGFSHLASAQLTTGSLTTMLADPIVLQSIRGSLVGRVEGDVV